MRRILEPELMEDEAQAAAYAGADFEKPHSRFVELFQESFACLNITGAVIDLGCGPGDIMFRIAGRQPAANPLQRHYFPPGWHKLDNANSADWPL